LQRPGAEFDRVARGALVHRGNRRLPVELSRDSLFGQRIDLSLAVQRGYGAVDQKGPLHNSGAHVATDSLALPPPLSSRFLHLAFWLLLSFAREALVRL
jgi:hypothetical protein